MSPNSSKMFKPQFNLVLYVKIHHLLVPPLIGFTIQQSTRKSGHIFWGPNIGFLKILDRPRIMDVFSLVNSKA